MYDSRILLEGLKQYKDSLEKHCNSLKAEFQQLENRWQSFNLASEGDYINQFRAGWAKTCSQFQDYINQSQNILILLDERIQSLRELNRTASEAYGAGANSSSLGLQPPLKDAASSLASFPADKDNPWNQEYGGSFNQAVVDKIPENLKGIYHICSSDYSMQYIGKSDRCIKGRLKSHLKHSSNSHLRSAIASSVELIFLCWESPDPKYEEAIEIKRLKEAGLLKGQRNEKKPLIEDLD